jgi:CubicO group peptidase (beta-lactamase class C family)
MTLQKRPFGQVSASVNEKAPDIRGRTVVENQMNRRTFLMGGLGAALSAPLLGASSRGQFDAAAAVLEQASTDGVIRAASLSVIHAKDEYHRAFGAAKSPDAMFLLASISKTFSIAAVMTLVDKLKLRLDDPVVKYLPEFSAGPRSQITLAQLLTHTSGLPDQLPENAALRKRHASLAEFVEGAVQTPLLFEPGKKYSYSSMGILLASEVGRRIAGGDFRDFVDRAVYKPLDLQHSAMGLGRFRLEDLILNQTEKAAPESGGGDPTAKDWDWNSVYWRTLGAPWGTAHGSAPDVARFYFEFMHPTERMMKPETARLMIRNHNPEGVAPRGLGFAVGSRSGAPGCSAKTFGHGGSTGTLVWADPGTDTVCAVLTTLPGGAVTPHPRDVASGLVAKAVS